MAQFNMNVTPDFEEDLRRFMRIRGIKTRAAALRIAVREGLQHALSQTRHTHFLDWIGAATGDDENSTPRFGSDDELWGE